MLKYQRFIILTVTQLLLNHVQESLALSRDELHDIFEPASVVEARGDSGDSVVGCASGEEIIFGRTFHVQDGVNTNCITQRIGHCNPGDTNCSFEAPVCQSPARKDYSGVLALCGPNSIPNSVVVTKSVHTTRGTHTLSCPTGMKILFGFHHAWTGHNSWGDVNGSCLSLDTQPCEMFQQSCTFTPCNNLIEPVAEIQLLCIPDADVTSIQDDVYTTHIFSDLMTEKTVSCGTGYTSLFGVTVQALDIFTQADDVITNQVGLANDICPYGTGSDAKCTIPQKIPSIYYAANTGMAAVLCIRDREPTSFPTHTPTVSPTTLSPTVSPTTLSPTVSPTTLSPTEAPTTISPTVSPTTISPTVSPTTLSPTVSPTTISPTVSPTTVSPTLAPTALASTDVPTTLSTTSASMTLAPTGAPTKVLGNPQDEVEPPRNVGSPDASPEPMTGNNNLVFIAVGAGGIFTVGVVGTLLRRKAKLRKQEKLLESFRTDSSTLGSNNSRGSNTTKKKKVLFHAPDLNSTEIETVASYGGSLVSSFSSTSGEFSVGIGSNRKSFIDV